MKTFRSTGLLFFFVHSVSFAAVYMEDFEDEPTFPGPRIAGSGGWTTNESSTSNSNFLSFWIRDSVSDYAAGLGGVLLASAPVNSTVGLTHSYTAALGTMQASFEFAITDSNNTRPNRDTFSFGFSSSGTPLFEILFVPREQTATPGSPPDAPWDLFYSAGGGPSVPLHWGVLEGGTYDFSLTLSPNGSSTNYSLTIDGSSNEDMTGTVAVNPGASVTDFGFEWTPTYGQTSYGNNFIVFDNINVVPEPSSTLLLGVAGLGLALRRRRA